MSVSVCLSVGMCFRLLLFSFFLLLPSITCDCSRLVGLLLCHSGCDFSRLGGLLLCHSRCDCEAGRGRGIVKLV